MLVERNAEMFVAEVDPIRCRAQRNAARRSIYAVLCCALLHCVALVLDMCAVGEY